VNKKEEVEEGEERGPGLKRRSLLEAAVKKKLTYGIALPRVPLSSLSINNASKKTLRRRGEEKKAASNSAGGK